MTMLSIGKAARRADVSVETIRFYERKGLLTEPARKPSGYRQYSEDDIRKLVFIRHAKNLGFSLNEIKELLTLHNNQGSTSEIKHIAENKLQDIESKIDLLQRMRETLKPLVEKCPGHGPSSECPILDALMAEDEQGRLC